MIYLLQILLKAQLVYKVMTIQLIPYLELFSVNTGTEAMSMTGERSELRPPMVKFPSILDIIQRRLSHKQGQNYANERQTQMTRDMLQALLQNNNRYY